MATHIANFGSPFVLQQYADNTGFIPEPGDKRSDFNYQNRVRPFDHEIWEEFIAEGQAAIARFVKTLRR